MVTTLYLSGPMTGRPDLNRRAFHAAAEQLREAGYAVISPVEVEKPNDDPTWSDWMKADVVAMMRADAIATLDGVEQSRGAQVECTLASGIGMPIAPVDWWLDHPIGVASSDWPTTGTIDGRVIGIEYEGCGELANGGAS